VLWLQWEMPDPADGAPAGDNWLAWTADLWPNAPGGLRHQHFHVAWVHPHGTRPWRGRRKSGHFST